MRTINEIIIHHSWTTDLELSDFEAIKRFHTSWRYEGNIVSEEQAQKLLKENKKVISPWQDIGYHYVIEKDVNAFEKSDHFLNVGDYIVKEGRPLHQSGAHTYGVNKNSIGICIIGNYDKYKPNYSQLLLLKMLIKYLKDKFGDLKVSYHRDHASYKSCPGLQFYDSYKEVLSE